MHDKTALEISVEFVEYLGAPPANVVVMGDAVYRGIIPNLVVPFTGHLTPEPNQFNTELTAARQIIERVMGAKQVKWRMQQLKENRFAAKGGVEFASRCVVAAAVLHNRFTDFLT